MKSNNETQTKIEDGLLEIIAYRQCWNWFISCVPEWQMFRILYNFAVNTSIIYTLYDYNVMKLFWCFWNRHKNAILFCYSKHTMIYISNVDLFLEIDVYSRAPIMGTPINRTSKYPNSLFTYIYIYLPFNRIFSYPNTQFFSFFFLPTDLACKIESPIHVSLRSFTTKMKMNVLKMTQVHLITKPLDPLKSRWNGSNVRTLIILN